MYRLMIFLSTALMAQVAPPAPRPPARKPAVTHPATRKPAVSKPKPVPAPMTDEQKTIYALGLTMYRSLTQFDLSPAEFDIVRQALVDGQAGKPALELKEWGPKIQPLATARTAQASQACLAKAAAEPGAVKTDSGLIYREVTAGTGASPKATDTVKVNYRGTLTNGTEFDSSYARNEPAQFPLNGVIRCWTEGLQKMKVGGKSVLACPADLAYGNGGKPPIPPGAALVFEIELLDIPGGSPQ